ncbi:hypothetical protein ASF32_00460 [Methylobacterium sp. Leaf91]|nr:hypothetical protein ASF24_09500 [Methylobacterium sp. Leaf86]KQP00403.1 hypothetical protein ASF32_00460 [Methylobacterium sp. Leaf91]
MKAFLRSLVIDPRRRDIRLPSETVRLAPPGPVRWGHGADVALPADIVEPHRPRDPLVLFDRRSRGGQAVVLPLVYHRQKSSRV